MNEMTQVAGEYTSPFKARYDNFIGGSFVAPVKGQYFDNITPITGAKVCEVARSTAEDVELALDAAHAAKESWGKTSAAERASTVTASAMPSECERPRQPEVARPRTGMSCARRTFASTAGASASPTIPASKHWPGAK